MASQPTVLIPGVLLTTSNAVRYTTPGGLTTKVYEIILAHTGEDDACGVNIYLVESGDSPEAKNQIYKAAGFNFQPGETKTIGMEQRLSPGTTIVMSATIASVVSVRASGDEVS